VGDKTSLNGGRLGLNIVSFSDAHLEFRMSNALTAVHTRLEKLISKVPKFDQTINLIRLRIGVPLVRKSLKPHYPFVSDSCEFNLASWNEVWKLSNIFEAKSQAIYFYQYKRISRREFEVIADWVSDCTCWEHSDDLSKIIASVTEENPKWSLPVLRRWVKSGNPWHRRQSLVGMIEYARKRQRFLPFNTYIKNIDPLLNDKDHYVQKAVGWTLREVYNAYPDECLKYQKLKIESISSIAYPAATEKMNSREKTVLNNLRKRMR
jgi:3-methyladenine DNA glycosylase AlkD